MSLHINGHDSSYSAVPNLSKVVESVPSGHLSCSHIQGRKEVEDELEGSRATAKGCSVSAAKRSTAIF